MTLSKNVTPPHHPGSPQVKTKQAMTAGCMSHRSSRIASKALSPGSQARTGPRGRGRDPLGQGPGPGPLGPGAGAGTPWARGLGAPGPKMWDTRGDSNYLLSGKLPTVRQTTYCQANYLLSGKLPTIRQATYYQTSYLLSGMHPNVAADFAPNNRIHAPNNRIHAPNRSIDMHPKGIDMHPNVSIYFAPNNRILS